MLALLMRIAVEGAAIAHPAPVVDADMARPAPVVDLAITACDPMLRQTESRNARPGGMLDRSRDAGEARRYLLFDLRDLAFGFLFFDQQILLLQLGFPRTGDARIFYPRLRIFSQIFFVDRFVCICFIK